MEKYFDKPILWIQDGKTPEYLTLVGGLLIWKDAEEEGVIREFEPHDLEQVMQLWLNGNLDAHDFIPVNYWTSHAEMVRMHLLQAELLVFVQKNTVLGFAGMQGDYLAGIFVDGQHRSNGIGKQLLEHLKQIHPAITLHVYRRNVRALEFYRKEGFQVTAEEWDAQTGENECTMVWHREND
ncbi:MAG: GNAT family N-acetyltransferase [Clostridiaceae bacterium]|nr:GNAT family N-acetyltransferase [Clostridiaceae bacterium]